MKSLHPDASALAGYVIGVLEPREIDRVDRHVRVCEACAVALSREARAETRLRAALDQGRGAKVVRLPQRRTPARRPVAANALAAAAALVLAWGFAVDRGPRGAQVGRAAALGSDGALVCELDREEPLCRGPATIVRQSLGAPADRAVDRAYEGDVCRMPTGGLCRADRIP
jgi:hypothetical protein